MNVMSNDNGCKAIEAATNGKVRMLVKAVISDFNTVWSTKKKLYEMLNMVAEYNCIS